VNFDRLCYDISRVEICPGNFSFSQIFWNLYKWEISWMYVKILVSQEAFCCTQWVTIVVRRTRHIFDAQFAESSTLL